MADAPSENNYEVEKILQKRTRDGVTEYLVRWLGYVNMHFCDINLRHVILGSFK